MNSENSKINKNYIWVSRKDRGCIQGLFSLEKGRKEQSQDYFLVPHIQKPFAVFSLFIQVPFLISSPQMGQSLLTIPPKVWCSTYYFLSLFQALSLCCFPSQHPYTDTISLEEIFSLFLSAALCKSINDVDSRRLWKLTEKFSLSCCEQTLKNYLYILEHSLQHCS